MKLKRAVQTLADRAGLDIRRTPSSRDSSVDEALAATVKAVAPYTMASQDRLLAACDAVRYVDRSGIPGAIVECGVWKGGTTMAMAITALEGGGQRDVYLFDTFSGMSEPTDDDADPRGVYAERVMELDEGARAIAPLAQVRQHLARTAYPENRLHFVVGMVETTVPAEAPDKIAVLRLDTDWYESTRHELEHLVPRIVNGGVLLIDDYGHWSGARKAVDEWIGSCGFPVLMARTDYTGRMAVIHR